MSVDAINQQHASSYAPAIAGGLTAGAIGTTAGYFWGGKRPTLEEVFAQDADTFKSSMQKAESKDAASAQVLKDEMNRITTDANVSAKQTDYTRAKTNMDLNIANIADYENKAELETNYNTAKNALNTKEVEIDNGSGSTVKKDFNTVKNAHGQAKAEYEAAADADKAAKKEVLDKAQKELDLFKSESEAFKNAEKAIADAKLKKFEELAKTEGSAEKELKAAFTTAESELNTAKQTFIDGLKDNTAVKDAFKKIKGALIEGRGKAMMIWGGIALAAGAIGGLLMGGKKEA